MPSQALADAFLVLWVWPSHLALPALLATVVLARNVDRHPAFLNMIVTEILGGIFTSILLYAGYANVNGPLPSLGLCSFQASLLAGVDTLGSLSLFGLVYQVYATVRNASRGMAPSPRDHAIARRRTWILIVLPYTTWLLEAFGTALYITAHPAAVARSGLPYCAMATGPLRLAIVGIDAAVLAATLVMEALSVMHFVRIWRGASRHGGMRTIMDTSIRIGAFALLLTVALVLALISIVMPGNAAPDLVMSTMGTFIFFIFGTQRDILRAWARWLHLPESGPTAGAETNTRATASNAPITAQSPGVGQFSSFADEEFPMQTPKLDDKKAAPCAM